MLMMDELLKEKIIPILKENYEVIFKIFDNFCYFTNILKVFKKISQIYWVRYFFQSLTEE